MKWRRCVTIPRGVEAGDRERREPRGERRYLLCSERASEGAESDEPIMNFGAEGDEAVDNGLAFLLAAV